jgi:hypothetical protein
LAAWKLFCKPKKKGGLGIIKLHLQNDALLMKIWIIFFLKQIFLGLNWSGPSVMQMVVYLAAQRKALFGGEVNLDNFFSKADLPWVKLVWSQCYANGRLPGSTKKSSFWWRSILKLPDTFKGFAGAKYGTGDTILFWHDVWNHQVLKVFFPRLHSFAKDDSISLSVVMQSDNFGNLFHLPLSEVAYDQYCELTMILQGLSLPEQNDKWSYIWGNDSYLVNKAYDNIMGYEYVHPSFKWIWRSKLQIKQKVFFWLLL